MGLYSSDYGSGSSTSSSSSWMYREKSSYQPRLNTDLDPKSSSYFDLLSRNRTLDEVMREFKMNGSDSPYNPGEDRIWARQTGELSGLGPSAAYLRQKSWPEPERSPAQRLPRPRSLLEPLRPLEPLELLEPLEPLQPLEPRWNPEPEHKVKFATSTPIFEDVPPAPFVPNVPPSPPDAGGDSLTAEQARALHSLPDSVLYSLLRGMRTERRNKLPQECRFCKNNGETASFYRSHALKDCAGRVSCPVLRAFTCRRCGARGDAAHTIKYCPLSTNEERIQSAGMMRSVRMASGRRRHSLAPSVADMSDYVVFGECTPSVVSDNNAFYNHGELDPLWAALEQKLSLY